MHALNCTLMGLILVTSVFNSRAQSPGPPHPWPAIGATPVSGKIYNATRIQYGFILLKNGEKLVGWMKILPTWFFFIEILPEGKYRGEDLVMVYRDKINFVRAYHDPERPDSGYTDFINLRDEELWRVLASRDSLSLYDDFTPNFHSNQPFGYKMVLVRKGQKWIKIYNHYYHDFDGEIIPRMLAFINKRYKTHFAPGDFKDAWAMIHYILERESGEESPGSPG
jgi:hypothetical protein